MQDDEKIIVVNATSLLSGGALTILEQFLCEIRNSKQVYYVFISSFLKDSFESTASMKILDIDTVSKIKRIWWDCFGLNKWLRDNNVKPSMVLSLQNTSVNIPRHIPQFIYLHQALSVHPQNWSPFKSDERKLLFYKYIYPIFIRAFIRHNTTFVVQTNWMREAVQRKFKFNNIKVLPPQKPVVDVSKIKTLPLLYKYNLFYPSNAEVFKNHTQLIYALAGIKKDYPHLSLGLYFTIRKQDNIKLYNLVTKLKLQKQVVFLGAIAKNRVFSYYKSVNSVVFPSLIESYGLPLLEAQQFIKPVVVIDEPYAREVIADYEYAIFAQRNVTKSWQNAILKSLDLSKKINSDKILETNSSKANFEDILLH